MATPDTEVSWEEVVAAIEVVKTEGVKTLVTNVTNAVVEVLDEATEVTATPVVAVGPDEQ